MDTRAPLTIDVSTHGVQKASQQMRGLARETGTVGTAATTAGAKLSTSFGPQAHAALQRFGGALRGIGVAVLAAAGAGVRAASENERKIRGLGAVLKLSGSEMEGLRDTLRSVSDETGVAQTALADAVRTASDFGASLSAIKPILGDLDKLAVMWGTDLQTVSPAIGAALKATAGELTSQQTLGLVASGVRSSGLQEDAYLAALARFLPQIDTKEVGGGQNALALFGATAASVGEEFVGDPRKMRELLRGMIAALKDEGLKRTLRQFGANTDDAGDSLRVMFDLVRRGALPLERLPTEVQGFAEAVRDSQGAADRFSETYKALTGDTAKMSEELQKQLPQPDEWSVAWGAFKNQLIDLGTVVLPVVAQALSGFSEVARQVAGWFGSVNEEQPWSLDEGFVGGAYRRLSERMEQQGITGVSRANADTSTVVARPDVEAFNLGASLLTGGTTGQWLEAARGDVPRVMDPVNRAIGAATQPPVVNVILNSSPDGVTATARETNSGRTLPVSVDARGRESTVTTR